MKIEKQRIVIVKTIKTLFKQKPITIIVEEDLDLENLTSEEMNILGERMKEVESTYFCAKDSIDKLKDKYGL